MASPLTPDQKKELGRTRGKPLSDAPCCENCVFWQEDKVDEPGECHRFPPFVEPIRHGQEIPGGARPLFHVGTYFPPMMPDDWCGEFERYEHE